MDTSFIIITRNRKEMLRRALKSIYEKISDDKEVIVIIDNSKDSTYDLKFDFPKAKFIASYSINGVSASRNIGIKNSMGKYIIFLDDDTEIKDINIAEINRNFELNANLTIIAPKILNFDNTIQESIRTFPTFMALLWRGTFLSKLFPKAPWYKKYINADRSKPDWCIGACMIIKRELFDKIGMFDERFTYGYDDVDICYRTKKAGFEIKYLATIEIFHHYARESAKNLINYRTLLHIKSICLFFFKKWFTI